MVEREKKYSGKVDILKLELVMSIVYEAMVEPMYGNHLLKGDLRDELCKLTAIRLEYSPEEIIARTLELNGL